MQESGVRDLYIKVYGRMDAEVLRLYTIELIESVAKVVSFIWSGQNYRDCVLRLRKMRGFLGGTFGQNILHNGNSMNKRMETLHNVSLRVDRKHETSMGHLGKWTWFSG